MSRMRGRNRKGSTDKIQPEGLAITIDPGVSRTGYAIWRLSEWGKLTYPVECGVLTPGRKGTWEERAEGISKNLRQLVFDYSLHGDRYDIGLIERAYIEEPKYFADKAEGDMVAKTNSLGKLYMLVGLYTGVLWHHDIKTELVRVDKWKSTLPKDVVIQRVRRRLPEIDKRFAPKADAWDALGMGLGIRGYLSMRTK